MALVPCYECGAEISDMGKSCPKCGAPVAKLPQDKRKRKEGPNLLAFTGLAIGIILLSISMYSDSWVVGDMSNNDIQGVELQMGLTHIAIDCSDVRGDEVEIGVCKMLADMLTSSMPVDEYVQQNKIDDESSFEEHADSLPDKNAELYSHVCSNSNIFGTYESIEDCEDIELAGVTAFFCGVVSVLLGVLAITHAVFHDKKELESVENKANLLAYLSTGFAYSCILLWLLLTPSNLMDSSRSNPEYGWGFHLTITALVILSISIILMIYWQFFTQVEIEKASESE